MIYRPNTAQINDGRRKAVDVSLLFIAGAYIVGYIVDQVAQKNKYHHLWWQECDAHNDMADRCSELSIENRKLKGEM